MPFSISPNVVALYVLLPSHLAIMGCMDIDSFSIIDRAVLHTRYSSLRACSETNCRAGPFPRRPTVKIHHLKISIINKRESCEIYAMAPAKLKIGCAGLGRMGKRHALHFLNRTPRAELVAASSPDDAELQWAKQHLEPFGVRLYSNYEEMLKQEGLQAVVIASVTTVHAEQAIKAMEANKHVLCEKPLSTSVEIVS